MSSGGWAAFSIVVGILLVVGGTTAVIVWSWHRLQQHRADAVAMASYRKLAEEAVANQQELRDEMRKLAEAVAAVEQLMRDVG
jgi:predicted negative regulator of RcsB-dependent stress response